MTNTDVAPPAFNPPPLPSRSSNRIVDYRRAFNWEFNPVGASQEVLVGELARRAAQMYAFDEALHVVHGEITKATRVLLLTGGGSGDSESLASASALANERAEALLRQGLAVAKGFHSSLRMLVQWQRASGESWQDEFLLPDPRFSTEAACHTWLTRRFLEGVQPCARCNGRGAGSVIAARRCWECNLCSAQTGLRVGTVMQASNLPLTKWFQAIRVLLLCPTTTARQLSKLLCINRTQTVSDMVRRIRKAMRAGNSGELLAGLAELYVPLA